MLHTIIGADPTPRYFECDLLVVGAGINGAAIARDAAGRGFSVVLCDKDDLASHTSSSSTKLIHGGLRYLEHYEFGLVRKALAEREVLLRAAPHIMWPLRFVMPHDQGQRPAWLIRAGLFLYDHLAKRDLLPGSDAVDLRRHASGAPLKPHFTHGFTYSDGWVDDARLVVLNAVDAAEKGATVLTRTVCLAPQRHSDHWRAALCAQYGVAASVTARCIVNATGAWAPAFLNAAARRPPGESVRLVKGSHIVVRRLFAHSDAYIFQQPDKRIIFAIPYEQDFTLIGTTDLEYRDSADRVEINRDEIAYLCAASNRYFLQEITPTDVVWSYSGVRALLQDASLDPSSVTRDYELNIDTDGAPILSVFGGKITTSRKLAEEAVDRIAPIMSMTSRRPGGAAHTRAWTSGACLPGGDLFGPRPSNRSVREFGDFTRSLQLRYSWLPAFLVARYARAYGTRIHVLLDQRGKIGDMGEEIADGLYAAEVTYLVQHEWASSGADILWRRSKLGLHVPNATEERLDTWLQSHRAHDADADSAEHQ
ncbi:MAG: glycerol-3-phosphate dehydrogenase [Burkholderiaceae bacterium]